MTTPWLTAAELAAMALPDWPGSEFRSRAKLVALQVPSRVREGRFGGGGREYDTSALPVAVRRALLAQQLQQGAAAAEAAPPAPLPTTAPTTVATPQGALAEVPPPRRPSKAESACADARLVLVNHLRELAGIEGGMTHAVQRLSRDLANASAPATLLEQARIAHQRPRQLGATEGVQISERSLFRWVGDHRSKGWQALLPAPTPKRGLAAVDDDVARVLTRYASASGAARNLSHVVDEVNRQLGRHFDEAPALYERARRALAKVDKTTLIKARHRGAERSAKLPFKRRLTADLYSNQVWVMDGHTFKAKVRHPVHGQPFAPEVTLCLDAADRFIVGWSVALSENVRGVAACLRHAISEHGVPAIVYTDNGGGETAKALDCPVVGLYARLGITHKTGLPGEPQGHGIIERSWQTHMIRAARKFATYQGEDADAHGVRTMRGVIDKERRAVDRARKTGEVVTLTRRVPSWAEFIAAVAEAVATYNAEHRHRSLPKHTEGAAAGRHLTPAEARPLFTDAERIVRLDAFDIAQMALPSVKRKAVRGEVEFLSRHYFSDALMSVADEWVRVDYDLLDATRVWVWTLDGEYVAEALETRQKGSNGMRYMPEHATDAAERKRQEAALKRLGQKADLVNRERMPTLPAATSEWQMVGIPPAGQHELQMVERVPEAAPAEPPRLAEPNARPDARPDAFDSASHRYEWLMAHRAAWTPADGTWLASYVQSPEYAGLRDWFDSRGIAWPEDPAAFNAAG